MSHSQRFQVFIRHVLQSKEWIEIRQYDVAMQKKKKKFGKISTTECFFFFFTLLQTRNNGNGIQFDFKIAVKIVHLKYLLRRAKKIRLTVIPQKVITEITHLVDGTFYVDNKNITEKHWIRNKCLG